MNQRPFIRKSSAVTSVHRQATVAMPDYYFLVTFSLMMVYR